MLIRVAKTHSFKFKIQLKITKQLFVHDWVTQGCDKDCDTKNREKKIIFKIGTTT